MVSETILKLVVIQDLLCECITLFISITFFYSPVSSLFLFLDTVKRLIYCGGSFFPTEVKTKLFIAVGTFITFSTCLIQCWFPYFCNFRSTQFPDEVINLFQLRNEDFQLPSRAYLHIWDIIFNNQWRKGYPTGAIHF